MKKLKNFGIFLLIMGVILLLSFIPNITGAVISENSSFLWWKLLSPIFILVGIFLMGLKKSTKPQNLDEMVLSGKTEGLFLSKSIAETYEQNVSQVFGEDMKQYREGINNVLGLAEYSPKDKIVDLGGGTGISTEEILKRNPEKITVVDISESMLNQAKKRLKDNKKVELKVASAGELSDVISDADKIVSVNTFNYFSNPNNALNEIYNSLQQNGEYLFNIQLKSSKGQSVFKRVFNVIENVMSKESGTKVKLPEMEGLEPKYTKKDIEKMVEKNHFKIKKYEERPIIYDTKILHNLYEQILTSFESKLADTLGKNKAQKISQEIMKELNELDKSKRFLAGIEAYISLEKS